MTDRSEKQPETKRRPRRWIKRLLIGIAVLAILLVAGIVGGFFWLTQTNSGASFALNQARGALPALDWRSTQGNLRDGLVIEQLELKQAGSDVQVARIELAAAIKLFGGPQLIVERLRIENADIVLPPPSEEEPADSEFVIPDLSSPVSVLVESAQIENARLFAHQSETPLLVIDQFNLAGEYGDALRLDELELRTPQGQLSAQGEAGLSAPHRLALDLDADLRMESVPNHQAQLTISGPLDNLELELSTSGPAALQGPINVRGLPTLDFISAELQGQFTDWPDISYSAPELALKLEGQPDDWTTQFSAQIDGPELPDNQIRLTANGSTTQARLESLRIETLDGEITAQGRAAWDQSLSADVALALERLDLTELYPDLPAQARLNGALDLALADDAVILNSLTLRAPPTTLSLTGNGRYDPTSDDLALDLVWQDFNWPPVTNDAVPLVSSQRGEVKITGRLSDWQAELNALLKVPDQPQAELDAALSGSQQAALIERLNFDAGPAGKASVSGEVQWQPEFQGRLAATLDQLNPAEFVAQLPGSISADVEVILNSPEDFTVTVADLDGELRGQAISGGGRIQWLAEAPQAGSFDLVFGDNQIELNSDDGERWAFEARANALDQIWPGLSGDLNAEGEILPGVGELNAQARLVDGGFDEITLDTLNLDADLRWREPTRANVLLTLQNLDLNPWERIAQLELTLNGRCRAHDFGLNFAAQRVSLDLAGSGQWLDCLRGGERWTAGVERLFIGDTLVGDWRLREPLDIVADSAGVKLGEACVAGSGQNAGEICLQSTELAPAGQPSTASVALNDVPMDLLLLPINPTFSLTSMLSGELNAGWTAGQGLDQLGGVLSLSAGALTPLGVDQALLNIDRVQLDLEPSSAGVLARLDAQFEGNSRLSGAVGIDDLRAPDQSTVNGQLSLNLPDIGVFNRAVAELDSLSGELQAEMAIRGRLGAPQLEGQAQLVDGALRHSPLGLAVSDIQIDITGSNLSATLDGQMKSGDGDLNLQGALQPNGERWAWQLSAKGNQFSVADVDWMQLAISPDVSLEGQGAEIAIDGDVLIERLKAGLPPGRASQVTASEHVVVLGETDSEQASTTMVLDGRLGIDLGPNARLEAAGLETRLAGQVELLWNKKDPIPRSRGVIRLPKGSFEAYGQNLEIEGGEIILSNQPITNPRLEIDAVRDIFGDPLVEFAGVSIRGNAQSPEIKLFTSPPTSEEKALAYVLTGADFDHAGGEGAVNVGLYLLPKLFVSYGIGLFESGNVLSGRYELSRRWGVRVVSGERDTGVDMSYAVDK